MPYALDPLRQLVRDGRYKQALDRLWDAIAIAQDTDDHEALAEIAALADEIAVRGSPSDAQSARRLVDSVRSLHPEAGAAARNVRPQHPVIVTTGNDLPGRTVTAILGPVFGMTVRSRDFVSQFGAKLKGGTVGGELQGMTEAMEQSRSQVLLRMEDRARALGADAVIAMRFDVSEMAGMWTEICAYGTAVKADLAPGNAPAEQPA